MANSLSKFYRPLLFQGSLKLRNYFEGWYFKHVSADRRASFSFIPGISLSDRGSTAFVQLIDGATGATRWFPYPLSEFEASSRGFAIRIGPNRFSLEGARIRLGSGADRVEADLSYAGITPLPPRPWSPGIMGPFSFAPFLECYHGIGSLDHRVDGSIRAAGREYGFHGGSGYLEKDWGRSMPTAWVWAQSNTFGRPGVSFTFSLARVPWLRGSFPGFFALLLADGRIRRFATYTGARVSRFALQGRDLEVDIQAGGQRLILRALRSHEGVLLAPVQGAMDRRIAESIDARLSVRLEGPRGEVLFEGTGENGGLEVVGDVDSLRPPSVVS